MWYSDLPGSCKECEELKITHCYMSGGCDYTCYNYACMNRPALKETIDKIERK